MLVLKYHVLAQITIYVPFIRTVNAVVRLHQQPQDFCATISALYQCVRKCSQCVVIKFLNKTLASLPRKKIQSGNRFLDVITCKYDSSCAKTRIFPSIKAVTLEKAPVTTKLQNFVGFAVQTMNKITNCLAEP